MASNHLDARSPIRVGAVSYLNTKPLVYGLSDLAPRIELSFDLPSRLADQLAAGHLDVALIPSIEVFQNPAYRVISDACIGCQGPVWSVKLLSRVAMPEMETLALDEGSRTSVALTRILLQRKFGLQPKLLPLPIGTAPEDVAADGVLVIGDRAIHAPQDIFVEEWDLGEQWCRTFGLPFVFAMWTARPGFDSPELVRALQEARDAGLENLSVIAEREAPAVKLTTEQCLRYLRDNLHFYLGDQQWQSLAIFREESARLGLAPPLPDGSSWDDVRGQAIVSSPTNTESALMKGRRVTVSEAT